jgi:hypothetical protein
MIPPSAAQPLKTEINTMTEDTVTESQSPPVFDRDKDRARLKRVAIRHGGTLLAAFTLWGAADYWASGSGLLLAEVVALFNAVFAGTMIAYLVHEWGHFTGARLAGSFSPVMKEPVSFFMFSFKEHRNSQGQFVAMSLGGPAANWLLVFVIFFGLPLETWSQCLILATVFAVAVSVSVFEFPIINQVMYGADPAESIRQRQAEVGNFPRSVGILAGAILWLMII